MGSAVCGKRFTGRRTSEPERLLRDVQLEGLLPLAAFEAGYQEHDLHARTEAGGAEILETVQVNEEEFLGKMKIFLQKPVARKRAARIRQQSFGIREACRP